MGETFKEEKNQRKTAFRTSKMRLRDRFSNVHRCTVVHWSDSAKSCVGFANAPEAAVAQRCSLRAKRKNPLRGCA